MTLRIACFALAMLILAGCNEDYSPKPKAYHRIVFPEKNYMVFAPEKCPYSFEIAHYSTIEQDSIYFDQKVENPCWYNIHFPELNGTVNITYKKIGSSQEYQKLTDDAHKLAFKHTRKADYIDEINIKSKYGAAGVLFEVEGDAASNFQFYFTDTFNHFVRGALYFNNTPNIDSMAPVVKFVREDMDVLIESFRWK
jgi:gliding motility-associated lipoprotein GldD